MIHYKFADESNFNKSSIIEKKNSITFHYPCNSPYQCASYTISLQRGVYLLEAWGASGSTGIGNQGGYGAAAAAAWRTGGGYSSGVLSLNRAAKLYFFIGSSPINGDGNGGYNGGGNDLRGSPVDWSYGGGGGATDFRLLDNENCLDETSLRSRILVAGGSAGSHEQPWGRGGYGGGEVGYGSLYEGSNKDQPTFYATGGTQESGGTGCSYASGIYCTPGSFGQGGVGYDGGGGGGGWYGGGGGLWGIGGGGGSSFAYYSKDQKLPQNYGVNERFLLYNPILLRGDQTMPSHASGFITGNLGHGAARILIISSSNYHTCAKKNPIITPTVVIIMFVMLS